MSLAPRRRRARAAGALVVREGLLDGGLPCLAVGQGPPLVVFSAFTAEHASPTGATRRFYLQPLAPLARHGFTRHRTRASGTLRKGAPTLAGLGSVADRYPVFRVISADWDRWMAVRA